MWFNSFEVSASKSAGPPHPRELLLRKSIAKTNRLYKETFVRCLAQARGTQRIREAEQELNRKRD